MKSTLFAIALASAGLSAAPALSHAADGSNGGFFVNGNVGRSSLDAGPYNSDDTGYDVNLGYRWSLNPNVGIGLYEDGQGRTFTSGLSALTLNYNPTPRINPFVDMGLQASEERNGRSSLILDAGIAYLTSRNVQLDISYGTGVLGRSSPHPFWSAGVSSRY